MLKKQPSIYYTNQIRKVKFPPARNLRFRLLKGRRPRFKHQIEPIFFRLKFENKRPDEA
jgi:hypothetical protein